MAGTEAILTAVFFLLVSPHMIIGIDSICLLCKEFVSPESWSQMERRLLRREHLFPQICSTSARLKLGGWGGDEETSKKEKKGKKGEKS